MLALHHRLAVAGVITATAIALPAAALASGPGSPSGKPAAPRPPAASACQPGPGARACKASQAGPGKPAPPGAQSYSLTALAASAGISVSTLQAGLEAAKRAGGGTAAGVAAVAAATGVSHATALRVMDAVFGPESIKRHGPALQQPQPVSALAAALGVSHSAAQHAFNQLDALSPNGIDPASPAFAVIARDLGVTPARLAAALRTAKQSMAGK